MKLIVDEMPYFSDDCPFGTRTYDGVVCRMAGYEEPCEYLHPFKKNEEDRGECPHLITLEEAMKNVK